MAECAATPMNQPPPHEITALLCRVAQGERDAFQTLYRLYYPPLHRFTSKLVPVHIAEEIATEVFLKVLEGAARFTETGKAQFFTWLCQVARNKVVDFWRDPANHPPGPPLDDDAMEQLLGGSPDIVHQLEMHQDQEALRYCIGKLPVEQRVPLMLIYWGGASLSEVAADIGCPDGTVKSRMSAARASLYQCVSRWVHGGRYGKSI